MVKHGALLAPKEVVVQKQYFIFLGCMFKNVKTKTTVFGTLQEIGLLKKVRGKRFYTILSKQQQKGFSVLKHYKDAKSSIFSPNSGKRHLFMKGKCTWKWFLFYCLPLRGKKSYAKRQLLSTLLNTSLDLCLPFGHLTTLFWFWSPSVASDQITWKFAHVFQ